MKLIILYPNTNGVLDNFDGMKKIREYAIKKLSGHSNEDLNFILLQLVQAIRYEDISLKNVNQIKYFLYLSPWSLPKPSSPPVGWLLATSFTYSFLTH